MHANQAMQRAASSRPNPIEADLILTYADEIKPSQVFPPFFLTAYSPHVDEIHTYIRCIK